MISACHAGYVLPGFYHALAESGQIENDTLRHLLRSVSAGDCDTSFDVSDRKLAEDPLLRAAANFISRGLPTLPSLSFEQFFAAAFSRSTVEEDTLGRFRSRSLTRDPDFLKRLRQALYALHPPTDDALRQRFGKSKAAPLLKTAVPMLRQLFGPAALALLESDERRACLQLPFRHPICGVRGLRISGTAAEGAAEQSGLQSDGWYQLGIVPGGTKQLQADIAALRKILSPDFPSEGIAVDASSLLAAAEGREALQLMLSPIAAARTQRALVQALLAGALDLAAAAWTISVSERDIPGAALGIDEFGRLLRTFFAIEGKGRKVPPITAVVSARDLFADSPLHAPAGIRLLRKGEALPPADVHVDLSMLHPTGDVLTKIAAEARHHIVLRPARTPVEPRRFLLGETERWKTGAEKGGAALGAETRAAVVTLLADAFRIGRTSPPQDDLFAFAVENRSFLAALPPMTGKSVAYQFAALLQPALSFVVEPTAALVADQRDQLADVFIDGVECQHEAMGSELRQSARARFGDRQALFFLASGALFRTEEVDEMLQTLRREKGYFSQCVIDEADGMSDWSHHTRPELQCAPAFAADRLDAGKKKTVALRLLTGSISRDVVADLRFQVAALGGAWALGDNQCLIGDTVLQPQQQFELQYAPAQASDPFSVLSARQDRAAAAVKAQWKSFAQLHDQAAAAQKIPGWDVSSPLPTVLYCPYTSGTLGVSNRFAAGATEAAVDEVLALPGQAVGIFIGKDDDRSRIGRQCQTESIEARGRFRRGDLTLLIATRAYGVGMHKPDIRCTTHLMPPPGVERLVQECGRGGHDGRMSLHTVLFGGSADSSGGPDLQFGLDILAASATDAAREKQLLHDLLREITYPEDSNTGRVANLVTDEFGIHVRISYWQRGLEERMYAQHGTGTFGYIDLVTQEIVPDTKYPDARLARDILEYAYEISLESAGSGPSLSSWVAATFPADIDDGIIRQMADFEPGAAFTLRIGYENDREPLLNRIHHILWREAEIELQRKILSEVQGQNWKEFRDALLLRVGQPDLFASLNPEIESRLVQLYNKIRTRGDTERIIFRLATLGVVQDYLVHPASRRFALRIAVRSDGEIRSALEEYLRLFHTERQAERAMAPLNTYPGESQLERCLLFLIDYSHTHCRQKNIESARLMDALCRFGMKEEGGRFREAIETALTAKYALPWRLPAALPRTTDRLRLLAEYMKLLDEDRSGSVRENAWHLAAACSALTPSFPDEPMLPMLRVLSDLILTRKAAEQKTVLEAFAAAFASCAGATGIEGERYLSAVAEFEARFRVYLDDQSVAMLLSLLHDEVKRVKARPLPAAISLETVEARKQAAARKAAEQKAAEQKAAEQKAAEQKAAEQKAAEQKAAEQKAAEQKAAEQKAAEQKARQAEGDHTEKPGAASASAVSAGAAAADAERSASTPVKSDAVGDELDRMLAELEGTLAADATPDDARRQSEDVSPSPAAGAAPATTGDQEPADPDFVRHLKWIQSFNHSFLKHYES